MSVFSCREGVPDVPPSPESTRKYHLHHAGSPGVLRHHPDTGGGEEALPASPEEEHGGEAGGHEGPEGEEDVRHQTAAPDGAHGGVVLYDRTRVDMSGDSERFVRCRGGVV